MDEMKPFAGDVRIEGTTPEVVAAVTSMLDRLHSLCTASSREADIPEGTMLLVGPAGGTSESGPTAIQLRSLTERGKQSQLAALLGLGILTSGIAVTNGCSGSAWHLLIQSRITSMQGLAAGVRSESAEPQPLIALQAKLYARPPEKLDTSSPASSAWYALVPMDEEQDLLSWLCMVLQVCFERTSGGFAASLS